MRGKLLTLDDLYQFYSEKNETCVFSADESDGEIYVQVPAQYLVNKQEDDDTLFFGLVRCFHIGRNRNQTSVTEEAARKAMKTMAYKPILANFCEIEDENGNTVKDFTSHDMVVKNGVTTYYEKQVGCFTADEPYMEEYDGKQFVYAYAAIPIEYTATYEILRRKGGTKVSVELKVNKLEYNSESRVLELTDVQVMGLTLLGTNPKTGKSVQEGMGGARLDILDFNKQNNSMFLEYENKMIELQDRLQKLEAACFNNAEQDSVKNNSTKGGELEVNMKLFEELLAKYNKTAEDISFEYKNLSDEDLKSKFAEMFEGDGADETDTGDNGDSGSDTTDVPEGSSAGDETDNPSGGEGDAPEEPTDDDSDEGNDEDRKTSATNDDTVPKKKFSITLGEVTKSFELSANDKIQALTTLVNSIYGDDGCWYQVTVFDDYIVMHDYWNETEYYKQSYIQNGSNFELVGEREEVFVNFLTKEEQDKLEGMRANYDSLVKYKESVENDKAHAEKESILSDERYSALYQKNEKGEFVNDEYAKLYSEMDNYSVEDLTKELKAVFSDFVISSGTYSAKGTKPTSRKIPFGKLDSKPKKRYGSIFQK